MYKELITDTVFERMYQGDRVYAVAQLEECGVHALPVLKSLFDGTAKNRWGVPYRKLGTPLDCALIVVARLGSLAQPLEKYLRAELVAGHPYAAQALGALEVLEDDSVIALSQALCLDTLIAFEAADALVRCKADTHPSVQEVVALSGQAERVLARVIAVRI